MRGPGACWIVQASAAAKPRSCVCGKRLTVYFTSGIERVGLEEAYEASGVDVGGVAGEQPIEVIELPSRSAAHERSGDRTQ
jgi:hypothetical protein